MISSNSRVHQHYDTLLAPIYAWMIGDHDAAQSRAREEIERIAPFRDGAVAIDLGAGLGFHARALADAGHASVWMVDTNARLLAAAADLTGGAGQAVQADLAAFREHVAPRTVDTIVCMGDTLTHLADHAEVARLLTGVTDALEPGGVFLTTFRDYTRALSGADRFVPVRSDARRILTVFLEYRTEVVEVHDVLWERHGQGWRQHVSSYPKLRLDPDWVAGELHDRGLAVQVETGDGMTRMIARR
jgi:SAM-dependent methyltransferase